MTNPNTEPSERDREVFNEAYRAACECMWRYGKNDNEVYGRGSGYVIAAYRAEIEAAAEARVLAKVNAGETIAAAEQRGYERGRASAVDWLRKEENWWRCSANLTFWQRIRLLGVTLSLCKARGIGSKNAAKYIFGKGPKIVTATYGFAANAIERNEQEIRDGE